MQRTVGGRKLGGRAAGGETGETIGRGPIVTGARFEQLGGVRRPDIGNDGQLRDGLVTNLADRAAFLVVGVPVPDDLGGLGTGQRDRQNGDPGAPAGAASHCPCVHGNHTKSFAWRAGVRAAKRRGPLGNRSGPARPVCRR